MRPRSTGIGVIAAVVVLGVVVEGPALARPGAPTHQILANRCFAVEADGARHFLTSGVQGYSAAASRSTASRIYLKPTGLGTYLLYDRNRGMLAEDGDAVVRTTTPGPQAQWRVTPTTMAAFTLRSTADHRQLVAGRSGSLALVGAGVAGRDGRFSFLARAGCRRFPEARLGASGTPRSSVNSNGTVFGWADLEFHQTASYRVGGDVIAGEDFDPFGVTAALSANRDEQEHGPDGTLDVTGNLVRFGSPIGTTKTDGWPSFTGWPTYDTETNQQAYWVWVERAWRSGMRLVVANASEDEPLCRLEPRRSHSCNEERSIELQIRNLKQMQDYIDAQFGGPGRGFFRIVYTPAQARRVISAGKLAVVMGVESSDPFGCSEYGGKPRCDRGAVDRGLARWWKLGIRTFFPIHWVDNAFGGAALEGGATGTFINLLNKVQTGHYFNVGRCPLPGEGEQMTTVGHYFNGTDPLSRALNAVEAAGVPTYPKRKVCNAKGLTPLGVYLIKQMISRHFMIMVDHISERGRERVLDIARRAHYPVVSPHTDIGGTWVRHDLRRLYAGGGIASVVLDRPAGMIKRIHSLARDDKSKYYVGMPFGSDTGGFASLPGPHAGEHPLRYPFTAYNGVRFVRERTGTRVFDVNKDGVAQYGLMPDLLAETQHHHGGQSATALIYRGAEAYLEAWERAG
ncbi:MAG TPA: hypothetical protein VHC43_17170 [Mycobacteriales bacterium]|nr:hypothetical protein [Mycobacteriales bacterium]